MDNSIGAASQRVLERLQSAPQRSEVSVYRELEPEDLRPALGLLRSLQPYWSGITPTRGTRELRAVLPAHLRAQAETRIAILNRALVPVDDRGAIEIAVGAMLAGFSSARATGDDAVGILAQYVSVLSELPQWAVERICSAYSHGRIAGQNMEFPPSAAKMFEKARDLYVKSLEDEKRELTSILVAPLEIPMTAR